MESKKVTAPKGTIKSKALSPNDDEQNILSLDPELRAELEGKGLVGRWVNAKDYQANFGYHRTGWRAYKREASAPRGSLDFDYGTDAEGYVRRRDLILGVKTVESHARHRKTIDAKNRQLRSPAKAARKQIQDYANAQGVKSDVSEGYDDDEA